MPDIGEYLVGAYLEHGKKCDGVMYNLSSPFWSYGELDVLGLSFDTMTAYLCEVTTHITGLGIGNSAQETIQRLANKHDRQREYARERLDRFDIQFMFWSPVVRPGLTRRLQELVGVELVINDKYTACVEELREHARNSTKKTSNEFFRALQLIEHMR